MARPLLGCPFLDGALLDRPLLDRPFLDSRWLARPLLDRPVLDRRQLRSALLDRPLLDGALLDDRRLVMTDTAIGAAPAAPSRVNRVVACTALLGAVSAAATCLAWSHRSVAPVKVPMSSQWLPLMLLLVTFVAEFTAVRLRRGDEVEALTLLEAAMVADVLLLPPASATVIAILGLAIASFVDRRRAIVKSIFNLGAHATGTALLVTMVSAIARAGEGLTGTMVAALLAGTLTFAALNLLLLSWVLSAATGTPIKETMTDGWRLSLVMGVGTCGIGAVAVGVGVNAPALLPFTLLPAAALTYAYRAAAQEADERERTQKLVGLTQVLAGRLVADDLLLSFLERLREAFAGVSARVVLEGDEESAGGVVLADEAGVVVSELSAFDAALLALAGATPELIKNGLPAGWGRTLIAPLEAEGPPARRPGAGRHTATGSRIATSPCSARWSAPSRSRCAAPSTSPGSSRRPASCRRSSTTPATESWSSTATAGCRCGARRCTSLSGLPTALATGRPLGELLRLPAPSRATTETRAGGSETGVAAIARSDGRRALGLTARFPAPHRRNRAVPPRRRGAVGAHVAQRRLRGRQPHAGRRAGLRRDPRAPGRAAQERLHRHRLARAAHADHPDQGLRRAAAPPRRGHDRREAPRDARHRR